MNFNIESPFLPGELQNLLAEMVQQDAVTINNVTTLWALSLTGRDFHRIYNRWLYETGIQLDHILPRREEDMFAWGDALLNFSDSTLRRVIEFTPSLLGDIYLPWAFLLEQAVEILHELLSLDRLQNVLCVNTPEIAHPMALAIEMG
jgi:hypothetical protein